MKLPWICYETNMKMTLLRIMIARIITVSYWNFQDWNPHESAMNLPWNWHETIIIFFQDWTPYEIDMNLPWKWHETNLKVTLIWYEYDIVNEVRQFWKFRESAMNYQTYMKPSCQIHRGFIADSCHFLSSLIDQSHVRFTAVWWQFHVSFMALSHPSLIWVQSAKVYLKKGSTKPVSLVDLDFFAMF